MFDYEDRAIFEAEPAHDDAAKAHSLLSAIATVDRQLDAQLAWLSAVSLLATLLFAVFVVSRI